MSIARRGRGMEGMGRRFSIGLAVAAGLLCTGALDARAAERNLDMLIAVYADEYGLPEELLHRVIKRESNYNPSALFRGNWGLMQIKYATAKSMGYKGPASGLLSAEVNLKYAVKYLAGAYLVAGGNADHAIRLYRRGYYYDAKRKGLIEAAGLKRKKK